MKSTRLIALGAALAFHAAGAASAAPARPEAVRAVLRAPEPARMTADDWRRLGDDVDVQLIGAAGDAKLVFGARQRAMTALGMLGGTRARVYLDTVLVTRDTPAPLLSSAVLAYARAFAKEDPAGAQRLAAAVLAHPDWQARRGAAKAMGMIGGEAARAALRAQESRETHPAVRYAIEGALRERSVSR